MRANGNSGEVEGEQERETKDRQIMGEGGKGKKREIELSDFSGGVGLGGASSAAEFINRAELPQSGRDSEVQKSYSENSDPIPLRSQMARLHDCCESEI